MFAIYEDLLFLKHLQHWKLNFLNLTVILLDLQQTVRKLCKNWIFQQNNILQYYFLKLVHGYLTMRCVK
jgi:hypothetical protein